MGVEKLYELFLQSTGVSTDTRTLKPGNIFFALKGENFNGNEFVREALKRSASYAVAGDHGFAGNEKILLVEDTLKALQSLASLRRKNLTTQVIAICGSNGKTTTKELAHCILSAQFKTFSTYKNLNNHIGVPLTLLSIPQGTEVAVIEMGSNHLGETASLCELAAPDFGVITNNGKDHLEGYGNLENVRKGNGELYGYLKEKNGWAFVCADDGELIRDSFEIRRITYGSHSTANAKGFATGSGLFLKLRIDADFPSTINGSKRMESFSVETKLYGKYNFQNLLAAISMGIYFEVPAEKIKAAVAGYVPSNNRSQVIHRNSNLFILDAYNANPSSVLAALDSFKELHTKNKWIILGDMLELGIFSQQEHEAVLQVLKKIDALVILVGPEFKAAAKNVKNDFVVFNSSQQLAEWFNLQNFSDQTFLIKGSRKLMLEKIIPEPTRNSV